jgi:uncharacterized protein (TIGR03083 family)
MMDADSLLTALASDGETLADTADGHLDRPVPSCPEWNIAGLVAHVGRVHGWVRAVIAAGGERPDTRGSAAPDDLAALVGWYRDGLTQLVAALSVDPETPAWTFSSAAPDNVGWWRRRQALETAVHRWDAQAAAAESAAADPIEAELAVEGIDELLTDFVPGFLSSRPVAGLTGTLHLHATDTPGEWWLDFDAPGLATRREHAKADTAVRGPASSLYLWLWNRLTLDAAGLQVFGRSETVEAWGSVRI